MKVHFNGTVFMFNDLVVSVNISAQNLIWRKPSCLKHERETRICGSTHEHRVLQSHLDGQSP